LPETRFLSLVGTRYMNPRRWRQIVGWIAASVSVATTCLWAFWGIIENFHEGWYYDSLPKNLGLMFVQYLSPMLVFLSMSLVSIAWPRVGAGLHAIAGISLAFYFKPLYSTTLALITTGPLLLLAVLYWLGRPSPRRLAFSLITALPLLTLLVSGAYPGYLAATRLDDGILEARLVEGNAVSLIWAPDGPGWPRDGGSWQEATRRCACLSEAGKSLADIEQKIWRLPTVEESVRSLTRRGENSGGTWDPASARASYRTSPNKESPLWNVHSKVVYWWTSTPVDEKRAYIVVYNGQVSPREKRSKPGYLAFRCVKEVSVTANR
jgi:hypothetical protein